MGISSLITEVENGAKKAFGEVEKYFVEGMDIIQKDVLPIARAAVAAIPGMPIEVTAIVDALPSLMTSVEAAFPAAGSGAVKVAAVTGAVKSVCDTVSNLSTGGQKNFWLDIEGEVNTYINGAIGVINKLKPVTVDTSAPDSSGVNTQPSA